MSMDGSQLKNDIIQTDLYVYGKIVFIEDGERLVVDSVKSIEVLSYSIKVNFEFGESKEFRLYDGMTVNGLKVIDYGFSNKRSSGGCYLTTACVTYFGKEDKCYELEMLRVFRDNFMNQNEEMRQEVQKYYQIAPKLVEVLNSSPLKKFYYEDIYNNLVLKSIEMIENHQLDEAYKIYKAYTIELFERMNFETKLEIVV